MLQLKNTKTRKLELFKPLSDKEVKVYFCGPTVYNYAHIGNLRAYVFEDIVIKTLRFLGYTVKTVMNITDIDDKTIRESQKEGIDLQKFTEKYTEIFLQDIEKLGIERADTVTPISHIIPEMTRMIQTMINRKNAYLSDDGSIYFDISTSKNYGKLANLDRENLKSSVRIDNDEYDKDNVADFVLWKSWKPSDGDCFWVEQFTMGKNESFSKKTLQHKNIDIISETKDQVVISIKGRPGWHIECSACAMKNLGQQIDLHMGGIDNLFPHHQNEVAQTEACTKKEFSRYWLHGAHLTVDGKKMAKSENNFYTIKDLEEKYVSTDRSVLYRALRLSLMNAKYSSQVDFSFSKLESNFSVIEGIDEVLKKIKREQSFTVDRPVSKDFSDTIQDYLIIYIENLEDDFNIPEALAVFHNLIKFINKGLGEKLFSHQEIDAIIDFLKTFNTVLGIMNFDILDKKTSNIPDDITQLFEQRNRAKKEKNFDLADQIRDRLLHRGYKIIDNREGSFLEEI